MSGTCADIDDYGLVDAWYGENYYNDFLVRDYDCLWALNLSEELSNLLCDLECMKICGVLESELI